MNYVVSCSVSGHDHNIIVSCRSDASTRTLFEKCARAMHHELCMKGHAPESVRFGYELPNVWTNGAIGCVWFDLPSSTVSIIREDGCCLAL